MIDIDRARADTPGSHARAHLDNATASLMPAPVLEAVQAHLALEAQVGSAEAADVRADDLEQAYVSIARLVNADPAEITIYSGGSHDLMAQIEPYVLDVSRRIGRAPVDVQTIEQTAIVASAGAYLRAPSGTGFLVLKGGRRATTRPSAADVLGLRRAVEYASAWGIPQVEARVDALSGSLRRLLSEIDGVTARAQDGIVSFEVAHRDPRDVAWSLRKRGITVGLNGTRVRVSPHYFNTEHELEHLAATVRDL